jgi:acyl dehydratase
MTLHPGEALPEFVIDSVSAEAMKQWAVFLTDPNPIHLDANVVKAKGLGDKVINQGPANVAYVLNMLLRAAPGATIAALDARFLDNAYAGDRLIAGGSVTARTETQAECDIWVRAEGRGQIISGTATLTLPHS